MENKPLPFYNRSIEETAAFFETSATEGLKPAEAEKRLATWGANEIKSARPKSLLAKFLSQFKSFMIIVLLAAAAISGLVGWMHGEGFTDTIIILAIVILNAVIGTAQEAKAEKSLEALARLSAPHCKVIRGGQVVVIESRELVPGDLVVIETGDLVPADLRLTEAVNLKIQEASLTGESLPEDKHADTLEGDVLLGDRENMAFSSSTVTYGRGQGLVVATSLNTEVGKIAAMIQEVPDTKTPLQVRLDNLGKILGISALVICLAIFVAGMLQGRELVEMFMIAVSLAAAAIPEGLPAVSTIVLAVGVQRLVKKHAIVRNLPSVETLGACGVICSDKTGTLTQNRMTVVRLYADGHDCDNFSETLGDGQRQLLRCAILANDAKLSQDETGWRTTGDPTETALLDIGLKFGMNKNELEEDNARQAEIPFDSERKKMTTVNRNDKGALVSYTKGGTDEVLAGCDRVFSGGRIVPLTDDEIRRIKWVNEKMAESALRVLAVAFRPLEELPAPVIPGTLESNMVFAGLLGMIDPPRLEVKDAVAKCRTAGIKPVMITGDHKITAVAIAESLGIMEKDDRAMTGSELEDMSDEHLDNIIGHTSVYARVAPEHKVRIVKAFQHSGQVVAMTGDGVNDAPALKLADIGVAMGITGTDVSKEAADIVLTDDNFATIVTAVEEGRRIYDNILKAIQFMLSTNIGELLVLFIAIMANWAAPLLPIQILWINLVTDSLPALALSVDPAQPGIMNRPPIDSRQGLLTRPFLARILLQGLMIAGLSLTAFRIGLETSVATAQTMTFAVLGLAQITHVLNVRSSASAFAGMFRNGWLWGALAIVLMLMIIVLEIPALHDIFHLAPLTMTQWWWIVGLSLAPLPIVEAAKVIHRLVGKVK
ncbi:calcium-translocating P-type ATPase, PMCA-type [Deltaproteobacteria bacterium Smac51]|nr:calcium-translocating P-type ATPase, PMCA-type [Deltaproteobacteria bacterium Smac51]